MDKFTKTVRKEKKLFVDVFINVLNKLGTQCMIS